MTKPGQFFIDQMLLCSSSQTGSKIGIYSPEHSCILLEDLSSAVNT